MAPLSFLSSVSLSSVSSSIFFDVPKIFFLVTDARTLEERERERQKRERERERESRRMSGRGLKLFDAHAHLQDARIYSSARKVLEEAKRRGVAAVSVNGCCEDDWGRVEALAEAYKQQVVPNFGLHPWFLDKRKENWLNVLSLYLKRNPTAGLGEVGLDKSRSVLEHTSLDKQAELLVKQLRLAKELGRPLSIHCVKAWGKMQECLKAEGPFPAGVMIHSFTGPAEVVKGLLPLNAYFSISLTILRLKEGKAKALLKAIPGDRMLIETDSPDGFWRREPSLGNNTIDDGLSSLEEILHHASETERESERERVRESERVDHQGGCCSTPEENVMETSKKEKKKKKELNHPANCASVCKYVAQMTGQLEETVASNTFANATKLFCIE